MRLIIKGTLALNMYGRIGSIAMNVTIFPRLYCFVISSKLYPLSTEAAMFNSLAPLGCMFLCTLVQAQTTQPIRTASTDVEAGAIQIHPENSKYFLFRGKPLVLIAAGEHYGSVVNREFDFVEYLEDAADKKQTMT